MQLHFSLEELKLLAEALEEQISRAPGTGAASDLLDHVIERNLVFGCDELEDLSAILQETVRRAREEMKQAADPAVQAMEGLTGAPHTESGREVRMKTRLLALEELCDKVTEACAMA